MKPFSEKRVFTYRNLCEKCSGFPNILHTESQIFLENMQAIHLTFSEWHSMRCIQKPENDGYTGEVKI